MALTEEQKTKIEEEEYRKHLQSKLGGNSIIQNPKIGKNKILIGLAMFIVGAIAFLIGLSSNSNFLIFTGIPLGGILALGGIVVVVVGKFQNWYHWK